MKLKNKWIQIQKNVEPNNVDSFYDCILKQSTNTQFPMSVIEIVIPDQPNLWKYTI